MKSKGVEDPEEAREDLRTHNNETTKVESVSLSKEEWFNTLGQ